MTLSAAWRSLRYLRYIHPGRLLAGGMLRRARAAQDARRFDVAAALYEEAKRLLPGDTGTRILCGHMRKEAGDFDAAAEHYAMAAHRRRDDPDFALQMGHFHKVAGRPDEAARAYARALALRPGWVDALQELARVGAIDDDGSDGRTYAERIAAAEAVPVRLHERLHIAQLGRRGASGGGLRMLRGIEAIRGYCIAGAAAIELAITLDKVEIHREPLIAIVPPGSDGTLRKHVFNCWVDFTAVSPGPYQLDLRFFAGGRRIRFHGTAVEIVPPEPEAAHPDSDGLVTIDPVSGDGGEGDIIAAINARPSMARPARRQLLHRTPRAILVQRIDQLGDLVVSVPAIRRLRTLYPEARIVGLLSGANVALASTLGLFDAIEQVDFLPSRGGHRLLAREAQAALRARLAAYAFDVAVDLGESPESRPLLRLAGATVTYGFRDPATRWLTADFIAGARDPVDGLETMAPSQKILAMIETLAVLLESRAAPVRRELDPALLARFGIGPGERFALLHVGARLDYSRWPHFTRLAALLLGLPDLKLVVLLDTPEQGAEIAALGAPDRVAFVHGKLDFDTFDALMHFCAVFVGNDSGPKHLAALRGAKTISLHMARLNWNEWGQEMAGTIFSRRVPCAGCAISDRPEECGKDFACLRHIQPEEVFAEAKRLLGPA